MSYTAPYIDATGPHIPTFDDIMNGLYIPGYQAIFGSDVYVGNDAQDVQQMGMYALALSQGLQAAQQFILNFSPATAFGAGLSSVVKINGISRDVPTSSTAVLSCVGQSGTVISNGGVRDAAGNLWNLPASVTIPLTGTVDATATCSVPGAVQASAHTINQIASPQLGWQSADNGADAAIGAPVQSDGDLRIRQGYSVSTPAQSIAEGIRGGILSLPGVAQCFIYVNETAVTDANGVTAHTVAPIVSGGDSMAIANQIYLRLTPGITSAGTVTETITDTVGTMHDVRFSPPTAVPMAVAITIKALPGYLSSTATAVAQAVSDYINALDIGQNVSFGRLYTPANSINATYSVESVMIARTGSPAAADVTIGYNEEATCVVGSVAMTVT